MSRMLALVYVVLLCLVAAALFALWSGFGSLERLHQWQAPAARAPSLEDASDTALQTRAETPDFPEVLQRPLFNPVRRPQPQKVAASKPEPPPPPSIIEESTLQGVMSGPTLSGVMLQHEDETRFVRVGDVIDGWKLLPLEPSRAVFENGDKRESIPFASVPGESAGTGAASEEVSASDLMGATAILVTPPRPSEPDTGAAIGFREESADDLLDDLDPDSEAELIEAEANLAAARRRAAEQRRRRGASAPR